VDQDDSFHSLLLENDDQRYPGFARRDLKSLFPQVQRLDLSKPGAKSRDVVNQAKHIQGNPSGKTLVIVSAGLNEFRTSMWNALEKDKVLAHALELTSALKAIREHFDDEQRFPDGYLLGVFNLYDPTDEAGLPPPGLDHLYQFVCSYYAAFSATGNLTLFNRHVARFAEQHGLFLLDVHGRFMGHGYQHKDPAAPHYQNLDPSLWFQMDCLHANERGNHEIRRLIWETMIR
jgi:hypothetical protein